MTMRILGGTIMMLAASSGALAGQEVRSAAQSPLVIAQPAEQQNVATLPANTEITLAMNDTITTKGRRWNEGDTFPLTVTHDVMLGHYLVVPRGSRAVGRITYLTNKGAFGKSGKLEIDLEYVEVSGRRIPLTGHYRQEGEGNTVATVAGVIAVGVFAGFVTGKSGVIPQGRELVAHTRDDLAVAFNGVAPATRPVLAPAPVAVRSPASAAYLEPAARPASQSAPQVVSTALAVQ
jgi:hypothetical protein